MPKHALPVTAGGAKVESKVVKSSCLEDCVPVNVSHLDTICEVPLM